MFLGDKSEALRLDERQDGGASKSNTLLKFETLATRNCTYLTSNSSLRFSISHEKPYAKVPIWNIIPASGYQRKIETNINSPGYLALILPVLAN